MTHSTQKCTVRLWQLLYGGIIPLEKTASVSHPRKRKVNLYTPLTQLWPICMRWFPRQSAQMGPLAGAAGRSQSFRTWRGKSLGVSVGGRETESNRSRRSGCLPMRSRGIREPRPWHAAAPSGEVVWRDGEHPGSCHCCSGLAPGYFSRDRAGAAWRASSNSPWWWGRPCFRHWEGGRWKMGCLLHSNISKWFILIIFRLQYVASYVKCTLKSN